MTRDLEQGKETAPSAAPPAGTQAPKQYPKETTYIPVVPGKPVPEPKYGEVLYYPKGKLKGWGGTAIVELLPSGNIIKTPIPDPYYLPEERDHFRNMRLEAKVFGLVGEHPRIPRIFAWDDESACLEMEYLVNGNLKIYMQMNQEITLPLRLKWCCQAAEAISVLHKHEVVHCDISPRNFLLDAELDLKISDFGGSSLYGAEPSATPETRFRHPGYDWAVRPVYADDIFSLGSLVYFIETGSYPYGEISSDSVEKMYESGQFPDTSCLVCGAVILKCWRREIPSACAVYEALESLTGQTLL
ncbi:kinase-like protein [Aspergillus unguis]